jgi:hypothetical protein
MSAKIPNFESMLPQGAYNKALFIGGILTDIFSIKSPVYLPNAWFEVPGIQPAGYKPEVQAAQKIDLGWEPEIKAIENSEVTSVFGTPVMGALEFIGGYYNMYNRLNGRLEKARYGDFMLPYSCIVDFSRDAVITETQTLGGTGTVKELYGLGDWQISIKGIAFDGATRVEGVKAHEIINTLKRWSDISDSIPVQGLVFELKEIDNIVIKSFSVQPIAAKYNVIPFTIEAVSDEPIELLI